MRRILTILLIAIFSLSSVSYAATTPSKDDLQKQIVEMNKQIEAINKEIAEYQSQIYLTEEEANTLSNRIKEITITRNKLLKQVEQTQKKISLASTVIESLDKDIKTKTEQIEITKKALAQAINEVYQRDTKPIIEVILTLDTFDEVSTEYNNRLAISQEINSFIHTVERAKSDVAKTKTVKEIEKEELSKLHSKLVLDKKAVDISKAEKDKLLKETQNKEEAYRKLLAESQKKRDAFEKEIRDYESQIEFLLNRNLLPAPGSEPLSWPLDNVFITQLFGRTSSSARLYVSGSHSGVDFRAPTGTPVKAMASGVVKGVGDTDMYCKGASFGKWVFIQYNNGLSSTFGHLSYISAKAGDEVKAGDVVGLSGNTGHSTGPHLHVTVYASDGASVQTKPSISCTGKTFIMPLAATSAYLDPMLYFPKISPEFIKK